MGGMAAWELVLLIHDVGTEEPGLLAAWREALSSELEGLGAEPIGESRTKTFETSPLCDDFEDL